MVPSWPRVLKVDRSTLHSVVPRRIIHRTGNDPLHTDGGGQSVKPLEKRQRGRTDFATLDVRHSGFDVGRVDAGFGADSFQLIQREAMVRVGRARRFLALGGPAEDGLDLVFGIASVVRWSHGACSQR